MHTVKNIIEISKSPAAVLAALTTKEGIKGWWTTDCECNEAERLATFRFAKPEGLFSFTFRLDGADERGVAMTCVGEQGNPDWIGTKLSFGLAAAGTGTRLTLEHAGFAANDEGFQRVVQGWSYFVGSLKSYVETGVGTPHMGSAALPCAASA